MCADVFHLSSQGINQRGNKAKDVRMQAQVLPQGGMLYNLNFVSLIKRKEMSTDDLKKRLHEGIENIDDNEFLNTIKELIDHKYSASKEPELSDWQLKRIRESEKQISQGDFLTNDEADQIIDKWLKE